MFDPCDVLKQLTLEEKASLCSGLDFWHLRGIPRLNVPSIMLTDGPHGLRKQTAAGDHVGLSDSTPATCFPPAVTLASTWNPQLAYEMGVALAQECRTQGVSVILGPGANIKRHPCCGRNFEYFSEDPLLSGTFASAWISGVQSLGIGTSLKHYALNNQESMRMVVDVIVDERAMHDIYLKGFKKAIQEAQPWTIMSAYNKVNGFYMSEHPNLLNPLVRDSWGFKGVIITDWGANNDRVAGLKAGQDVEMPGGHQHQISCIMDAISNHTLSMDTLNERVLSILQLIQKASVTLAQSHPEYDIQAHHQLARKIGAEGIVLLKNNGVLPLSKATKVALIGELAKRPRYQGSGSSLIHPHQLISLSGALEHEGISYAYAKGYELDHDELRSELIEEAIACAKDAEVVICMIGLPDRYESEGFDRSHLRCPNNHNVLVEALCQAHPNVVVCLSNGAPVLMPWLNQSAAVVEAYLGGQASGEALMDVLWGHVNPSGKLAETFPEKLEDTLSSHYFPGNGKQVIYKESGFVGYRWFKSANIKPAFAFGYGLSYSEFKLSNMNVHLNEDIIYVSGNIMNSSNREGAQTIQVYAHFPTSKVVRPSHTLIGFVKVNVPAMQSHTFNLNIPLSECTFTQEESKLESGTIDILVGTSSEDIVHTSTIMVESADEVIDETHLAYFKPKADFRPSDDDYRSLLKYDIPPSTTMKPYTLNSTLTDLSSHIIGKTLLWSVQKMTKSFNASESDEFNQAMIDHMVLEMPLRSLVNFSGGKLSLKTANNLLSIMNHGVIKTLFSKRG